MKKKKADFVHIPCFAVKCYSCFTVEGSKQHSLIPNFWNLISDNLYLPGVFKIVGPETSVPKMYPGHILNTYEAKVQMYHFLPHPASCFSLEENSGIWEKKAWQYAPLGLRLNRHRITTAAKTWMGKDRGGTHSETLHMASVEWQ